MIGLSLFLTIYGISIGYVVKYRKEIKRFIQNEYCELANKIGISVEEIVDVNSFKKINFKELIPLYNIYYELAALDSLKYTYETNKSNLCKEFPVFSKQYKLDEEAKNNVFEKNQEKEYFIGVFYEGRPLNIFFKFDGENVSITEETSAIFKELLEENTYMNLFYLLYCYYYGSNEINASVNIGEVFTTDMVSMLKDLFTNVQDELVDSKEEEMKLTRKK